LKITKEVKIGIVVVVAAAAFIVGLNFLKGKNIFGENIYFYASYAHVDGLVSSNPVMYNGFKVGQVERVELVPNSGNNMLVSFFIDNKDLQIPLGTKAKITSSILGSMSIELNLPYQDSIKGYLKTGDTLIGTNQPSLQAAFEKQLEPVKLGADKLLKNINVVVEQMRAISDTTTAEKLGKTFEQMKDILNSTRSFTSVLSNMIITNRGNINETISSLSSMASGLNGDREKVSEIISNFKYMSDTLKSANIAGAVNKAETTIESLSAVMEKITNGDGSLHKLVYSNELHARLDSTAKAFQELGDDMKNHPYRYIHFSVLGKKEKKPKFNKKEEEKMKKVLNNSKIDSLIND